MPPQATKDWLSYLEVKAQERGIYIDTDIDGRIFHFHLGDDPGIIGKVRYSEAKSRNYENEQGQKHIWHRYNRETEQIEQGSERDVVNVTLDVWTKDEFDPDGHHFIFLTERLLQEETYSKGDQKIWIEGEGRYSGPLAEYVDDWDAIFEYATEGDSAPRSSDIVTSSNTEGQVERQPDETDTSGTVTVSEQAQVQVSADFKERVYERFSHRCPLSGIERSEMLTVSHVLSRAENRNLAEDIENVLLLDWTHHMAFDADLWTFDESGHLWVKPGFETESEALRSSLVDQHGEIIDAFAKVSDEYIQRCNDNVNWWPPR